MSVDYDRSLCVAFVEEVTAFQSELLVHLWMRFAFDTQMPFQASLSVSMRSILERWFDLSLWNKQAILYALVPHIERVAKRCAWQVSQDARREERL